LKHGQKGQSRVYMKQAQWSIGCSEHLQVLLLDVHHHQLHLPVSLRVNGGLFRLLDV